MPISTNETFISPAIYTAKTNAIGGCASTLKLDNTAFSSADAICTTDVIKLLVEIQQMSYDLAVQHNTHLTGDLVTFLNVLAQSISNVDVTVSESLNEGTAINT